MWCVRESLKKVMYGNVRSCVHVCLYVRMYAYLCVCTYVYEYLCVCEQVLEYKCGMYG